MIYTCYFNRLKYLPGNMIPVSIAAKPPYWFRGYEYKKLAPTYDILMEYKETGDKERYIQRYYDEILSKVTPNEVVKYLYKNIDMNVMSVVLFCFEKPSNFCHRHIVAEWLTKAGYECKELEI